MPKNVVITPLNGLVDFYDLAGNLDAKIQISDAGDLSIGNTGGVLSLGNTASNVFIGDGVSSVDVIFEQNGAIRALTGKTLTLGNSASSVAIQSPLTINSPLLNTTTDGNFEIRQTVSGWTNSTSHPILKWSFNATYDDNLYLASGGNAAGTTQTALVIAETGGVIIGAGPSAPNSSSVVSTEWFRLDNSRFTISRNSTQSLTFENSDTTVNPTIISYSAANNAKNIIFDSKTDASNTAVSAGVLGYEFRVAGTSALTIATDRSASFSNNVTPTVTNTQTLGSASLLWSNVYATTFTGSLSGNATTATSVGSLTGIATVAPLVAGTAAVGTSTLGARQDHVHPAQTTVTTATNIAGGAAGSIPYQTAAGATSLLATGTGVLIGGATPSYTTTPTLTGTNFTGIPNSGLTNSSVTIGSTSVSLGSTVTTFAGLSSVTSTSFVGALTGNASGSAATFTSTTQNSQFNSVGVGVAASTTAGQINAGNIISSGIVTGTGGVKHSDTSFPMYQISLDFGSDTVGTWRKIITATLSAGTQYSTHGFKIKITDPNANHATQGSVNVDEVVYYVACVRSEATVVDTPDLCVVRGPASHVQAVKLATGSYEIQVQPEAQFREYLITIESYASNGAHTIVYSNGSTAGSAGIATYSASAGGATTWVDKLQSTGTITSGGTITTNSELITQGSAARLSLYRSDGVNYFDWSSGQSLYFSTQTSAGGSSRSTKMVLDDGANLGIGTTSPTNYKGSGSPAFVVGNTRQIGLVSGLGSLGVYGSALTFNSTIATDISPNTFTVLSGTNQKGGSAIVSNYDGKLTFYVYDAGAETGGTRTVNLSTAERMSIDASGNVTPGTTNTQTLGAVGDVWSNVYATTFTGALTGAASLNVLKAGDTMTGALLTNIGGGAASSTKHIDLINGTGYDLFMLPRAGSGSYNNLTQAGDAVIGFSAGAIDTGALVIGPWSASSKGLRIDSTGATTGTSFNSITGLSSTTPLVAGTAAVGTGTTVARADHVHPAQTTVSGNAGTVTNGVYTTDQVVTARATTVSTNSGDWNSQVTAGSYNVSGNGTWTGSTNGPTAAYPYGQLLVYVNGNIVTQHYFAHSTTGNYIRTKFNASDWQAWQETWTNLNDGSGSGLDADLLDGRHLDTLTANLRANRNITGGGTITFDASSNLLWSARFIVISNGRGAHFGTNGYFDITCPTTGTVTGVGGAANVTATAAGIPIAVWQALYYILPIGAANGSVAANFRIASYTADVTIPDEWLLIAVRNGDTGAVHLNNGYRLEPGESIDTASYNTRGALTAATLETARNINGTSFNGSAAITTASWGTARTITIGSTGKSVDGSAAVSWSLAEIGAQAAGSYLTAEADTLATVTGRGFITRASSGAFATNTQGTPGLEVIGAGTTEPAYMTFHRPSQYAVRFGLDGNDLKVGGWSLGNVGYTMLHSNNYSSYALPLSGGSLSGNITFSNGRKALIGQYDPTQTQAIFAMGSSYVLTDGGATNVYGNFYGLAWSYNPDYQTAGNNPQSKAGLNHQLLLMQAGVTTAAIGTGVWTSGIVTGSSFTGAGTGLTGTASSLTAGSANYLVSYANSASGVKTARNVWASGAYTYGGASDPNSPTTYFAATGFGNGAGGSGEIGVNWVSSGGGIWYRALRDTIDNWFAWTRILDASNYSSYAVPLSGGTMTGSLAINNSSPTIYLQDTDNMTATLHCNSSIFYVLRHATANTASWDSGPNGRHPMTLSLSSGDVTFSGNVTAYSDERLKKNINVISNPISKVKELVGVSFERLEGQKGIGLVAQNVKEVIPEVVTEDKDGYLSVAYGNIVGLLVEAIKEQQTIIDSQEDRISRLEEMLNRFIKE